MKIIEWIKKLFGIEQKQLPKEQPKPLATKDTRTDEEKILSSGDELAITAYYNHQAYKRGLTHNQLMATFEKSLNKKQNKTRIIKFEFVPKQQANRNVRTFLEFKTGSYATWQKIRNDIEEKAGCKCAICGLSSKDYDPKKTTNTECHEVWQYGYDENKNMVQKLIGLEALCFICHSIKHANQHYKDKEFFNTLMEIYTGINNLPDIELSKRDYHDRLTFNIDKEESRYKLDLSYLNSFGYEIPNVSAIEIDHYFDPHEPKFNRFLNDYKHQNKQNKGEIDYE